MSSEKIEIREASSVAELTECTYLQREVFGLPDLEISPARHLIVTKHAGGFTLGAYADGKLVGFVLSVPAFSGEGRYFYSHMTAVLQSYQSYGIGAKLKWAQRERALMENVKFIKWTFQPVQARNAFFNLEKLGATVKEYEANYYGTDYSTVGNQEENIGLDSDRLFGEWDLQSPKVVALSKGESYEENSEAVRRIEIPNNWNELVKTNPQEAVEEQNRIKEEFQDAFAKKLIAKGFERNEINPKYLLFEK